MCWFLVFLVLGMWRSIFKGFKMISIEVLQKELQAFADERDWDQFHSPKNLSMALSVEALELLECFQWLIEEQSINLSLETRLSEISCSEINTGLTVKQLKQSTYITNWSQTLICKCWYKGYQAKKKTKYLMAKIRQMYKQIPRQSATWSQNTKRT